MSDSPGRLSAAQQQLRRRPSAYAMATTSFDHKFFGFMISISGAGKTDRVLDVACGSGAATMAFAERCKSVVGIDVVDEPLARARAAAAERGLGNAAFTLGEVERIPFGEGAFTGAICRFSFHHLVHPERVFSEMARVVAPNGWMVISDMAASEDPEKAAFQNELERLSDPTHGRTLPISEFLQMFEQHGFRTVMKVERDSRLTVDDWVRFGGATPENAARLRELSAAAVEGDRAGLRMTRDGETIRLIHNSVSFVIEKEG
jgi:ubiquinone/menaquinone biosynthesis C-methylase UbiE